MNTFRLAENVPDTYIKHSRDFQLLCNSFDCLQGNTKYYIDSIVDINNTSLIKDNLLPLLQTKLGFFTKEEFSSKEIRTVMEAFKYMVKNKGSRKGILQAITIFLKTNNLGRNSRIIVLNKDDNTRKPLYIVNIKIESEYLDTTLLTELLRYVIPSGYIVEYSFYETQGFITEIEEFDSYPNTINIVFTTSSDNDATTESGTTIDTYENENAVSTSGTVFTFNQNPLYTFNINDQGYITSFNSQNYDGMVIVPTYVNNIKVVGIGDGCFTDSDISAIKLPISIIDIEEDAFYGCTNLTKVFYSGTSTDWEQINIEEHGNSPVLTATKYYNS